MSLLARADDLLGRGEPVAMLTVVATSGSAPREVGTRMLVTPDTTAGSIGGGSMEGLAIAAARAVLAGEEPAGVRRYDLEPGGNTGMVCGGSMEVFVERLRGQPRLVVAGAGHIAAALAPLADRLGYAVTVVDDREDYADEGRFPEGTRVVHGDVGEALADAPLGAESSVVVATRSGTFDRRAVAAALDGGAGYVGLVASETKGRRVLDGLADDGYDRVALARVRTPVGLDLGGGRPADVALSVLAELHAARHGASGAPMTRLNLDDLVVVRGGGDLASGVVYRLHRAGFPVLVTEVAQPTAVRRAVAFAEAVYAGETSVEGVVGRHVADVDAAVEALEAGVVPVLVDPDAAVVDALVPAVVVDATMAKGARDTGTRRDDAPLVVGLGPGFVAVPPDERADGGTDDEPSEGWTPPGDGGPIPVDAVVETDRGHELGRVVHDGTASPYTGVPGTREGYTSERVLYAETDGTWSTEVDIGDLVEAGDVVGRVDDAPVTAEIGGLVRGLVHDGVPVSEGTKLGDVDPRGAAVDPTKLSDKALCLGGGVLEAVLGRR